MDGKCVFSNEGEWKAERINEQWTLHSIAFFFVSQATLFVFFITSIWYYSRGCPEVMVWWQWNAFALWPNYNNCTVSYFTPQICQLFYTTKLVCWERRDELYVETDSKNLILVTTAFHSWSWLYNTRRPPGMTALIYCSYVCIIKKDMHYVVLCLRKWLMILYNGGSHARQRCEQRPSGADVSQARYS